MQTNDRIRIEDEGYPYFIAKSIKDVIEYEELTQFEGKNVHIKIKDFGDYYGKMLYVDEPQEYVTYYGEANGDTFPIFIDDEYDDDDLDDVNIQDLDIEYEYSFHFQDFEEGNKVFDYSDLMLIMVIDGKNEHSLNKNRNKKILTILKMYLEGNYEEKWMREDILPFAMGVSEKKFIYDLNNLSGVLQTYHKRKHVNDHMSDQEANTKLINIILPDIYNNLLKKYHAIYGEISYE